MTEEIQDRRRGSATVSQAAITPIQPPDTIDVNLAAFLRSLRAEHKSEKTIETYREAVVQLSAFLAVRRMPVEVRDLRREHIEAWMIELLSRWKPATVNNRCRGLQAFIRWCINEDITVVSPMAKMKPPRVPEQTVQCDGPWIPSAACDHTSRARPAGAISTRARYSPIGGRERRGCAFDLAPHELHFGLFRADGSAKPVADVWHCFGRRRALGMSPFDGPDEPTWYEGLPGTLKQSYRQWRETRSADIEATEEG
jgi:hypothetical protein